jgi:tetratricopeptide (TPR) repeat protein
MNFIGRTEELAILRDAWRTAVSTRTARLAAVRGPAGIGKTALVRAFLSDLGVRPPQVVSVSADQAGFLQPWGVLSEILRRLADGGDSSVAVLDPVDEFADPFLLATNFTRLLRRPDGFILVVDDAQRIDRRSLAVLRHAVRPVSTHPLLIILAYQAEDDPLRRLSGRAANPATPDLPQSWVEEFDTDRVNVLDLAGLTVKELIQLARARNRARPTADAVRLHELTGGHPLHAAYLLARVESKTLWAAIAPLSAPPDVSRAVAAGLAELPSGMQDVIVTAAVLGRRFHVADVRKLHGADVRAALARGVEAGLLDEEPGTGGLHLRFVTTLVRDAAYERLAPARRQELHRMAARLNDQHTVWHRVAASDGPDDNLADRVARVARDERREGRMHRAAQYLRQAIELTGRDSPHRAARLLDTVELLLVVGEIGTAAEYTEEIGSLPLSPWRGYVEGYLQLVQARPAEAREIFLSALAGVQDDATGAPPDLEARICVQLAVLGIVSLAYADIVEYSRRALELAPHDPTITTFAWFAYSVGLAMTGHADRALAELSRSTAFVLASGLDALVARGIIRLWTDDLEAAHADLTEAVQRATRGEALRIGQALAYLAEVEFRRGDLQAAVEIARWAVDDAVANVRIWDYALVRALACYPHAARGDWAMAEELVKDAGGAAWTAIGRAYSAGALAALAQARDEPRQLLAAADTLAAVLDVDEPGTSLYGPLRADALSRLGRLDEARADLAAFRGRFGGLGRRSTEMTMMRVCAQIEAAAGNHKAGRDLAFESLRIATSIGLPLEAGRIRLVVARCLHAVGACRAAERFIHMALRSFREMGAGAYVAQAVALATDLKLKPELPIGHRLTDVERGMIRWHLDGEPHRVIAGRLRVETKSVENRMRNVRRVKLEIQPEENVDSVLTEAVSAGV